jgi:CheY-like chemotaxis protein
VLSSGLGAANLQIDMAPGIWPIEVDVSEFEIALVNLVINARDAMPKGGTVSVKVDNVRNESGIEPGDHVRVTVTDTGSGIPADMLSKVFDPFFTTKPVGKGTGLGLSQVHGFVHQAGGTVKIDSKLNEGTSVSMFFPRAAAAQGAESAHTGNAAVGAGNVLLVEDNPDVASASTILLEQLGYAVRWAQDADSALRELETNGIDLVFSDIVMPGKMDGVGLARAIRDKYPKIPIVLATGYSERLHDLQGDFPVLRKPYQIHELSQILANLR